MIQPFTHPDYYRNEALCDDAAGEQPCCICGKPITKPGKAKWVMVSASSSCFITDETEDDGTAGAFPIGSACYRKYKKELRQRSILRTGTTDV